jgi:hypothetical protein
LKTLLRVCLLLQLGLLTVACAANADLKASATCSPGFPKGVFSSSTEADQMMADRLWSIITLSNEKALCETPAVHSQRLVVMPSFGRPRTLRIDKIDARLRLVWTQLSGRGGYDLGKAVDHRVKELSGQEADQLTTDLGKLEALMRNNGGLGQKRSDGTVWLLESWGSQGHQAAVASSPRGQLEELLRELLRAVDDQCLDCD